MAGDGGLAGGAQTGGGGDGGHAGGAETGGGGDGGGGAPPACPSFEGTLVDTVDSKYLEVDSTHVYWTECSYGTVSKVSKCGGSPTVLWITDACPLGLALDTDHVYWVTQGQTAGTTEVVKASKSGTSTVILASGEENSRAIVVDQNHVYWADTLGRIRRLPTAGGTPTTVAQGEAFPYGLALDDTHVYWGEIYGGVRRAPKAGGPPETLFAGTENAWCVALDDANVYWTTYIGPLMTVPKTGGTPLALSGDGYQRCLTTDATRVYWADDGFDYGIRSVPKQGGEATLVAQSTGVDVAVDDSKIYWTREFEIMVALK